jgi:hypothetical protein
MSDSLFEYYNPSGGLISNFVLDASNDIYAQAFTVGNTSANVDHYITSVKLNLYRVGSPSNCILSIYSTDGTGTPDELILETYFNGNLLDTTQNFFEIVLARPLKIYKSTKYAICINAPYIGTNKVYIRYSQTGTYTGGYCFYSLDWLNWFPFATRDILFMTYGTIEDKIDISSRNEETFNMYKSNEETFNIGSSNEYAFNLNETKEKDIIIVGE